MKKNKQTHPIQLYLTIWFSMMFPFILPNHNVAPFLFYTLQDINGFSQPTWDVHLKMKRKGSSEPNLHDFGFHSTPKN